jgi:hypothetical protein
MCTPDRSFSCSARWCVVGCSYFRDYRVADFAKSGMVADKTIIIDPNDNTLKFFPTTMFNLFRKYVTYS